MVKNRPLLGGCSLKTTLFIKTLLSNKLKPCRKLLNWTALSQEKKFTNSFFWKKWREFSSFSESKCTYIRYSIGCLSAEYKLTSVPKKYKRVRPGSEPGHIQPWTSGLKVCSSLCVVSMHGLSEVTVRTSTFDQLCPSALQHAMSPKLFNRWLRSMSKDFFLLTFAV